MTYRQILCVLGAGLAFLGCDSDETQMTSSDTTSDTATDAATDGSADTTADVSTDVSASSAAFLSPSCAPDDGPALDLVIAASDAATCSNAQQDHDFTFFYIYGVVPPSVPATYSVGDNSLQIRICPPAGQGIPNCVTAPVGSVTFESYEEGVGASGTWTLETDDGMAQTGVFNSAWCAQEEPVVCG